jgi:hypothetical protein
MRITALILNMGLLIFFISELIRVGFGYFGLIEFLATVLIGGSTIFSIVYIVVACDRPWFAFRFAKAEKAREAGVSP